MDHLEPVIEVEDLEKSFRGRGVLKGINLNIPRYQTTVILGESGSGKSVLLKLLCGLLSSNQGKIRFRGNEIQGLRESQWLKVREKITYIFQNGALFDSMSIYNNVAFPLVEKGFKQDEIHREVTESLKNVGLPDIFDQFPSTLSGGMKKRVALARGLVTKPEVILYDEPTTGLDPVMTSRVGKLIMSLKKQYNISSIVVTHDIKLAREIADYLVMIYDGKVHLKESRDAFMTSDDGVVKQFIEGRAEGPIDPLRARN